MSGEDLGDRSHDEQRDGAGDAHDDRLAVEGATPMSASMTGVYRLEPLVGGG